MIPKLYEVLNTQHLADLRRDAAGTQMLARARADGQGGGEIPRLGAQRRLRRVAAMLRLDLARPRRDLGAARRPELRQDVLDVAARGLRRDAEASAISALVMPSPISRATSNSRAVSGRHGSSSEACPRAIRSNVSARSARAATARRSAPVRASTAMPRPPRSGSCGSGNGPGRAAPRWPPRPARARPSRRPPPRGRRARSPSNPSASATSPRPWSSAAPATLADRIELRDARLEPARGLGRPARPLRGAHAGDHERREQHVVRRRAARPASARARARARARDRRPGGRPRPGPTAAAG